MLLYIYIYIYHTKDTKMLLDNSLLNTQHYKIPIKDKIEHSTERSNVQPYSLV